MYHFSYWSIFIDLLCKFHVVLVFLRAGLCGSSKFSLEMQSTSIFTCFLAGFYTTAASFQHQSRISDYVHRDANKKREEQKLAGLVFWRLFQKWLEEQRSLYIECSYWHSPLGSLSGLSRGPYSSECWSLSCKFKILLRWLALVAFSRRNLN